MAYKRGCKLEILCQSVSFDSTRLFMVSNVALSSLSYRAGVCLVFGSVIIAKLQTKLWFPIHYKPVWESQWLEQGAKFSSWNDEHDMLRLISLSVLFRTLENMSWKVKHAKRTCFSAQLYKMCVVFCEWVERKIKIILSVFNLFLCLCDVYLK